MRVCCSLSKVDYLGGHPNFIKQHMLCFYPHSAHSRADLAWWHNFPLDGQQHGNLPRTLPPDAVLRHTPQGLPVQWCCSSGYLAWSYSLDIAHHTSTASWWRCSIGLAHHASTMSWWHSLPPGVVLTRAPRELLAR